MSYFEKSSLAGMNMNIYNFQKYNNFYKTSIDDLGYEYMLNKKRNIVNHFTQNRTIILNKEQIFKYTLYEMSYSYINIFLNMY